MPLNKFVFKPGIMREGTAYDNEGGWFDTNLVRFNAGRPEKIGGWRKDSQSSFLGTCRALHSWVALNGSKFLGLGTHLKYYINEGDNFNDVTPIRATTTNGITFSGGGPLFLPLIAIFKLFYCFTNKFSRSLF